MSGTEVVSRRAAAILASVSNILTLRKHKLWSSALLGAVVLLARYWSTSKLPLNALVNDFSKIAKAKDGEYDADEFDVIIVGGGTAGCVLASRLSEDPSIRVLVLEAGKSLTNDPNTHIPVASGTLYYSEHGYPLYTEEQKEAGQRKLFWPRAKLLGGSGTNVNAMIFQCAHPTDYDEWASLQKGQEGASNWTYNELSKSFKKFEKYNPSKQHAKVDKALRGSTGVVTIGHYGYHSVQGAAFVDACDKAGIPKTPDLNTAAGTIGASQTSTLTYIASNGTRVTAERAYFTPTVLARRNLKIATEATVTRILFSSEQTPRAVGVEFANVQGKRFSARARKEVIVCGGAVHTPHVNSDAVWYWASGAYRSHGIPVVADLPGVGSHLKDHPTVDYFFMDKSKTSLMFLRPSSLSQQLALVKHTLQYLLLGTGGLTTNVGEALAFANSSDPKLFPPSNYPTESAPDDRSSGEGAPDIEMFCSPIAYLDHGATVFPLKGDYFALHTVALRPKSSGTVTLKSNDPFDLPVVDPKYFSEQNDIKVMVRAIRLVANITRQEPLKSLIDPAGDNEPILHHNIDKLSDAEIAADIRKRVETLYHPCCTARMAPLEDGGVVDPYLRVHGIKNLRVVDASVFPDIPSGHTTAPVLAVAEKAADFIKEALRG
ncbi:hypothetical protein EIP91_000116 [Steccherinum ochraceum]|uniref:Glucose-methanol-choline oxidoreductase N-terminal domain-containing protein n=1 Tax=Steccherinum ochraceum TaxID=92696 RepID=A0A4R0S4H9_9APHY|nr:hypothetical protein EIP91_000116 [Steccherinum ochraceum]